MANTTNYALTKPTVGGDADVWGGYLNTNWDDADALFSAKATTGSANAYVLTTGLSLSAYATGQKFTIIPNFTNSGAATINVDAIGAKNLYRLTGGSLAAVSSGDVVSGVPTDIVYDGTQFVVVPRYEAQPIDGDITAIAALGYTSGSYLIKKTAANTYSLITVSASAETAIGNMTAAGAALLDDASASAQCTTLGAAQLSTNNVFTGDTQQVRANSAQLDVYVPTGSGGTGVPTLRLRTDSRYDAVEYSANGIRLAVNTTGTPYYATLTPSGDFGVGITPSIRLQAEESGDSDTAYFANTNASLTSTLQRLAATRAATSAYSFLQATSSVTSDTEFNLRGDGQAYCDGSWNGGGADYAEFFEWEDGNPGEEDRRGISVVLVGTKIRPATENDDPADIIGAVSVNPTVIGDAAWNKWGGKYLKDEFGAYLMESYAVIEWDEDVTDGEPQARQVMETVEVLEDVWDNEAQCFNRVMVPRTRPVVDVFPVMQAGKQVGIIRRPRTESHQPMKTERRSYIVGELPEGVTPPEDAETITESGGVPLVRRVLNPNWDANIDYINREARPEWSTIGLMGKLRVRKGQPIGARWIKMRDVSGTVEEWFVR